MVALLNSPRFGEDNLEVLEHWPDVRYAVARGRKSEIQIIHCNRMRKKREQVLNFECDAPEVRGKNVFKNKIYTHSNWVKQMS